MAGQRPERDSQWQQIRDAIGYSEYELTLRLELDNLDPDFVEQQIEQLTDTLRTLFDKLKGTNAELP